MEDYFFGIYLAESVVKSLLSKHKMEWRGISIWTAYEGKLPEKIVILALEKAVTTFVEKNENLISDIMSDFVKNNLPTVRGFCHYAIEFGSVLFKDGFDPANFIKYSAIVVEMAFMLKFCCPNILDQVSTVIATVLISQIMTGQFEEYGGQEGLKKTCFALLKKLKTVDNQDEYQASL